MTSSRFLNTLMDGAVHEAINEADSLDGRKKQVVEEYESMDYRQTNKSVMDNTQKLCSNHEFLKKSIEDSIRREYIVLLEEQVELPAMGFERGHENHRVQGTDL